MEDSSLASMSAIAGLPRRWTMIARFRSFSAIPGLRVAVPQDSFIGG
jgi:hypothetical protein